MPKKLSTNTKAVESRERKAAVQKDKNVAEDKRKADAEWVDDDKNASKKQDKKLEEERKKAEALKKKAELKEMLEKEEQEIKKSTAAKIPLAKKSRAEIEKEVEQRNKNIENLNNPPKAVVPKVVPIEENINHLMADVHLASNIDDAIAVLKVGDPEEDRHPEKRMKAAFKAYENTQLPVIKAQNPSLKLSQLKQMIFKNWQKSPENPLNKDN